MDRGHSEKIGIEPRADAPVLGHQDARHEQGGSDSEHDTPIGDLEAVRIRDRLLAAVDPIKNVATIMTSDPNSSAGAAVLLLLTRRSRS